MAKQMRNVVTSAKHSDIRSSAVYSISQPCAPNTARDAPASICLHRFKSMHSKYVRASAHDVLCWEISGWSLSPQSTFHASSRPLTRTSFLSWHEHAHTKHKVFVDNQFTFGSDANNISMSLSALPAAESGPYRDCTVIV